MVLIIRHIDIEDSGTLGEFFVNRDLKTVTVALNKGELLPKDFSSIDSLVILGGPMNVYEEEEFPFLKEEDTFIKKAIEKEIPILGICLGAQLLAKACGAKVTKAAEKEIGWYRVNLTEDGKRDRLFAGIERYMRVFQWHEDTFELPEGSRLLAVSDTCRNQAFRFGKNAYGLRLERKEMLKDYNKFKERLNKEANTIYLNFSNLILDGNR